MNIPVNPKTGRPFKIGDTMESFAQIGGLLDFLVTEDVTRTARKDWFKNAEGNASNNVPLDEELPGVILILPGEDSDLADALELLSNLDDDCTMLYIKNKLLELKNITLMLNFPKGAVSGRPTRYVLGGTGCVAKEVIFDAWVCLQVGGSLTAEKTKESGKDV